MILILYLFSVWLRLVYLLFTSCPLLVFLSMSGIKEKYRFGVLGD